MYIGHSFLENVERHLDFVIHWLGNH